MGLILILIVFTGPIVHIVLSAMRINGKIKMSLGIISLLALGLDIVLPGISSIILAIRTSQAKCTYIPALFFGGSSLNIIASIVIGLIGGLIYLYKYKTFENKPVGKA